MKQMIILTLLGVALLVAATLTFPQSTGQPQSGGRPEFSDFDTNKDGSLTRKEFDTAHGKRVQQRAQEGRAMRNLANAPAFSDIDTDGDDRVSREEFNAHKASHRMKKRQLQ